MVTRTITTFVLFVLIFTLGIFECVGVNNFLNEMEGNITYLMDHIDDDKENVASLYEKADASRDSWETAEPWLTLMFNHKDLANICDSLSRLCTNISINDYEASKVELYLLAENAFELKDMMGFNLQNIL